MSARLTEGERLEQVWAALTNPQHSIRSIAVLAAEHGFDDLSAFNVAFKERYGSSPVVIRKAAKKRTRFGSRR